ncbi:hypothetical protein Tco_0616302 [Tanacetum coccineum]
MARINEKAWCGLNEIAKSTSGVSPFWDAVLSSLVFERSKPALAISLKPKRAYGSFEKACQQSLWMKQALVDYGVSYPSSQFLSCKEEEYFLIQVKKYYTLVMAALVISISSNVSVESVVFSFPRVILIGSSFVKVPVAPDVGAAAVSSPARVLKLDTHSSSEADPSESSPPPVSIAPMVSPFCV